MGTRVGGRQNPVREGEEESITATRYWEEETPVEVTTERNKLRWYPRAGRLHVSLPDWEKDGEIRQGKTVSLNIDALRESEDAAKAREIFEEIVKMLTSP